MQVIKVIQVRVSEPQWETKSNCVDALMYNFIETFGGRIRSSRSSKKRN